MPSLRTLLFSVLLPAVSMSCGGGGPDWADLVVGELAVEYGASLSPGWAIPEWPSFQWKNFAFFAPIKEVKQKILRVDLEAFSSVEELTVPDADFACCQCAPLFEDGTFGYVVPLGHNWGRNKVARFRLATFDEVEVMDMSAGGSDLFGFIGGFHHGGYGFLVPQRNSAAATFGKVVRFSLESFTYVDFLDLEAQHGVRGFNSGIALEGYGYLSPGMDSPGSPKVYHGKVVRVNLTDFSQEAVEVLDLDESQSIRSVLRLLPAGEGYIYGVGGWDGLPSWHGNLVRFSQTTFSDVEKLDLKAQDSSLHGLLTIVTASGSGYAGTVTGKIVHWDLESFAPECVKVLETGLSVVNALFVHGPYGYAFVAREGRMVRFWHTTTTTTTSSRSSSSSSSTTGTSSSTSSSSLSTSSSSTSSSSTQTSSTSSSSSSSSSSTTTASSTRSTTSSTSTSSGSTSSTSFSSSASSTTSSSSTFSKTASTTASGTTSTTSASDTTSSTSSSASTTTSSASSTTSSSGTSTTPSATATSSSSTSTKTGTSTGSSTNSASSTARVAPVSRSSTTSTETVMPSSSWSSTSPSIQGPAGTSTASTVTPSSSWSSTSSSIRGPADTSTGSTSLASRGGSLPQWSSTSLSTVAMATTSPGPAAMAGASSSLSTSSSTWLSSSGTSSTAARFAVAASAGQPAYAEAVFTSLTLYGLLLQQSSHLITLVSVVKESLQIVIEEGLGVAVPGTMMTVSLREATARARSLQQGERLSLDIKIFTRPELEAELLLAVLQSSSEKLRSMVMSRLVALLSVDAAFDVDLAFGRAAPDIQEQAAGLLDVAASAAQHMQSQLGDEPAASKLLPGGATASLTRLEQSGDLQPLTVLDPLSTVRVTLPVVLLAGLASTKEGRDQAALTIVSYAPPEKAASGGNRSLAFVSLSLVNVSTGRRIEVEGLKEPVEFSMPVNYRRGLTCMFWDEGLRSWSSSGVWNSEANSPGEPLVCLTRHFTLFGAILQGFVDAIACAHFDLFNQESVHQIGKGKWFASPALLLQWCSMLAIGMLALCAAVFDAFCFPGHGNLLFLVPRPEDSHAAAAAPALAPTDEAGAAAPVTMGSSGVERFYSFTLKIRWSDVVYMGVHRRSRGLQMILSRTTGADAACSETLRGICDEILSEWFEYISDVRSLLEEVLGEIELSATGLAKMSQAAMFVLVIGSSTRIVAGSLRLSHDLVSFILQDAGLREVLVERQLQRDCQEESALPPDGHWWTFSSQDLWSRLHADICHHIEEQVTMHAWKQLPLKVLLIFCAEQPVGAIFVRDVFTSAKLRALMLCVELMGSLMVSGLFLSTSGSMRGKHRAGSLEVSCADEASQDMLFFKVGRAAAIAVGSTIFAGFPVMLLSSLRTVTVRILQLDGEDWKRQLKKWHGQDGIVWSLGLIYSSLATFFVLLLLANLSNEDLEEWDAALKTTLLWMMVLMPLGKALAFPILAHSLLVLNTLRVGNVQLIRQVQISLHKKTNVMLPITLV